jgi:hypothetical protein
VKRFTRRDKKKPQIRPARASSARQKQFSSISNQKYHISFFLSRNFERLSFKLEAAASQQLARIEPVTSAESGSDAPPTRGLSMTIRFTHGDN